MLGSNIDASLKTTAKHASKTTKFYKAIVERGALHGSSNVTAPIFTLGATLVAGFFTAKKCF